MSSGGDSTGGKVLKRMKYVETGRKDARIPPEPVIPEADPEPSNGTKFETHVGRDGVERQYLARVAEPTRPPIATTLAVLGLIAGLGNIVLAVTADRLAGETRGFLIGAGIAAAALFGAIASVVRSSSETAHWSKVTVELLLKADQDRIKST